MNSGYLTSEPAHLIMMRFSSAYHVPSTLPASVDSILPFMELAQIIKSKPMINYILSSFDKYHKEQSIIKGNTLVSEVREDKWYLN